MTRKTYLFFLLLIVSLISTISASAQGERRNNLTDEEDELVREAQEIDKRMEIFVKVIDRRFLVINDPAAAESKQVQKENNKWGPLRTGTKLQMLSDIDVTLREAIAKLDDVAERDMVNPLFPKAVRILSSACQRWIPLFQALEQKATEEKEKEMLVNSVDNANQVIEAVSRLPKEEPKKKKN